MRKLVATIALSVAALLSIVLSQPAQARVHAFPFWSQLSARTELSQHPDSGGNGNWALDEIQRVFRLRLTGHPSANVYTFSASVTDDGWFQAIPNAFTPNQFGPNAGKHIRGFVFGWLNGHTTYTFTANHLPNSRFNLGIPFSENGAPVGDETTSLWYEQAFPVGTVFGGNGINNDWAWAYRTFDGQRWLDAASNNGGQSLTAGNIESGFIFGF